MLRIVQLPHNVRLQFLKLKDSNKCGLDYIQMLKSIWKVNKIPVVSMRKLSLADECEFRLTMNEEKVTPINVELTIQYKGQVLTSTRELCSSCLRKAILQIYDCKSTMNYSTMVNSIFLIS